MEATPATDNPVLVAMEAYRRTHPHRSDELDEAFERGQVSEAADSGTPARATAASEQMELEDQEPPKPPGPPAPPAPPGGHDGNGDGGGLERFAAYAARARSVIPPSKVDWSDSPFAWIRHNGPRTKSALAKAIVREWLADRGNTVTDGTGAFAHFAVGGAPMM